MTTFRIEIEDRAVRAALDRLARAGADLTPAMQDIGELLAETTKRRFASKTAPDGAPWARNAPSTVKRKGRDDPLIGESRRLSGEIFWRASRLEVTVGSGLEYAAVQQFGARKGQFGRSAKGAPLPWGDVPPRPFLGVSEEDRAGIVEILREHIEGLLHP